jgi:hypothetical protein
MSSLLHIEEEDISHIEIESDQTIRNFALEGQSEGVD